MNTVAETRKMLKIDIPLDNPAIGSVERLWAEPIGDHKYVLQNSPFYAYGLSYGDTVIGIEDGNRVLFSEVFLHGGNSTYRVKLPHGKNHEYFLSFWNELAELGCTYEGSNVNEQLLYAIDVPPGVSVESVYGILTSLEENSVCEFDEGYFYDTSESAKKIIREQK